MTRFIDPEILHWWSELMELPCCAIGGITAENCAPLVRAGADFLAVVGAVWSHPDGACRRRARAERRDCHGAGGLIAKQRSSSPQHVAAQPGPGFHHTTRCRGN